jgi:serine/threonine-protein kinase
MSAIEDQARSLFLAALGRAPDQWPAFLDEACGANAALRARVGELLHAHQAMGSIHGGRGESPATPMGELNQEKPGTVIGVYKLLEQIGEGSFGVVFMAEQQHPVRRKVALKVLKAGMDTRQVVARFEAERQALALMDHPHIARVLDAGETAAGRPYFVMDLVRGLPITAYCDQAQLTPRERLDLFVAVCQAVQHAHQKGIIHRDIKPSNVLVTLNDGTPAVKVIDFGIAKATGRQLTDKTLFTGFALMIGTPLYMSPEQAALSNIDVDTRSDIYSLGVLLYELLTGTTPLEKERLKEADYDELRRLICEEEPPRPSLRVSTLGVAAAATVSARRQHHPQRLRRLFRGELDWIVMKALEKDRARRYDTASAFAADVRRYLADEPVEACPPSAWYRFRKFARRNKGRLTAAGLVLFCLLLLGGGVGWLARDEAARRLALQTEAAGALDEAQALCREDRGPEATSAWKRAEALLAGGEGNNELARRLNRVRADLRMAALLEEIRLDRSAVRDGCFDSEGTDLRYRDAFRRYGLDLAALTADPAAERIRASGIRDQLLAALDDWLLVQMRDGLVVGTQLQAVLRRADSDPWRSRLREAFRHPDKKVLAALARDPRVLAQPPATVSLLGAVLSRAGEDRRAREVLRAAQERHPSDFWINHNLAFALAQGKPARPGEAVGYYRAALAVRPDSPGAYVNLGNALQAKGDLSGAVAAFRKAIDLQPGYAMAHTNLGNALQAKGDLAGAIATSRKAISQGVESAGIYYNLGLALYGRGDFKGAVAANRKAIALNPNFAGAYNNLGTALGDQGKPAQAIAAYRRAIALDPRGVDAHTNLGITLEAKGDRPGAVAAYRQAIALDPKYAPAYMNLGWALEGQGDLTGAIAAYRQGILLQPDVAVVHLNLGNVLIRTGDLAGSLAAFRKAIAVDPTYAEAYCNLGAVLERRGDFGKALAAMRRGHELGSKRQRPPLALSNGTARAPVRAIGGAGTPLTRLPRGQNRAGEPRPVRRAGAGLFLQMPVPGPGRLPRKSLCRPAGAAGHPRV